MKQGRPANWGSRLKQVTVTVPEEYIEFWREMGNGNVSEGVRILTLEAYGPPADLVSPEVEDPAPVQGKAFIYALTDPGDGRIRYVGKTVNPRTRYNSHLRNEDETTYKLNPLHNWVKKLKERGKAPNMVILEEVDGDWQTVERKWIAQLIAEGNELLNVTSGGQYGHWLSPHPYHKKEK